MILRQAQDEREIDVCDGRGVVLKAMVSAPRDGTALLVWCRHYNWRAARACGEDGERWEGWVITSWTDFNGGGWTWHGHTGEFMWWVELPQPYLLRAPASPREPS